MSDLTLVDYCRVLNPDKNMFTWKKNSSLNLGRLHSDVREFYECR